MSILIKNMEMPKNCTECRFACDGWCYAKEPTEPNSKSLATGTRPSWCPLIEIPPHGRLIDADALMRAIQPSNEDENNGAKLLLNVFLKVLKSAPTIIKADDSRKQGEWVLKTFCDEYGEYQLYECNLCGAVTAQRKSKNYCHNCGAKMESEGDDGSN